VQSRTLVVGGKLLCIYCSVAGNLSTTRDAINTYTTKQCTQLLYIHTAAYQQCVALALTYNKTNWLHETRHTHTSLNLGLSSAAHTST